MSSNTDSGCLESEDLAAFLDGRLPPEERARVMAHLATCEACYEAFAETFRVLASESDGAVVHPNLRRRLFAAVSAVAAVLALATLAARFASVWPFSTQGRAGSEIAALVKAVGSRRPVEARLTGGFAWGPVASVKRGATTQSDADAYLVQGAAGRVMKEMEGRATPEAFGALGTAQLVVGKTDESVAALEEAVRLAPKDARLLSDLSAAHLERARTLGRAEDLPRALEAASKAVELEPNLMEARFNKALVLDAMNFADQARAAWEEYLKLDDGSEWSGEVRRRLAEPSSRPHAGLSPDETRQLVSSGGSGDYRSAQAIVVRSPAAARRVLDEDLLPDWSANENLKGLRALVDAHAEATGDRQLPEVVAQLEEIASRPGDTRRSAFVEGHRKYADASALYRAGRVEDSVGPFMRARELLSRVGSPYAGWADLQLAIADYQRQRLIPALDRINRLLDDVRGRDYRFLEARALWMRGLVSATRGDLVSSLSDYRRALDLSRQLGETSDAASLQSLMATSYDALGEERSAWESRRAAFEGLDRLTGARRLRVLEEAAGAAERGGFSRVALGLLDYAVKRSRGGFAVDRALLRLDRALAIQRVGLTDSRLEDDVRAANVALAEVDDPSVRARLEILKEELEGEILTGTDPAAAARHLTKALESREASGEEFSLAGLHLLRGRALLASGRKEGADADFREGIAEVEKRLASQQDHRARFIDRTGELFDEAMRLALERGNAEEALTLTERRRSRDLLLAGAPPASAEPSAPLDAASLRASLAPDVALFYYAAEPERLLRWVVTSGGIRFDARPLGAADLARRVESYVDALRDSKGSGRCDALAQALYRDLIGHAPDELGASTTLVFIPDDVLWHLPFASLRSPDSMRRLIQDSPVGISPSGTVFVRARNAEARGRRECQALVVTPSDDHVAGFPSLPEARREGSAISGLYGERAVLLSGAGATSAAVKARLSWASIFHFAGHAQASRTDPGMSRLVLSEANGDSEEALYAKDLTSAALRGLDLAVLAGCATAAGPPSRSEGPLSLARAFLAGGTTSVLATLWDVDDRDARELLVAFHRHLVEGRTPLEALRGAQLEMSKESPSAWAFELFGSGALVCPGTPQRRESKS